MKRMYVLLAVVLGVLSLLPNKVLLSAPTSPAGVQWGSLVVSTHFAQTLWAAISSLTSTSSHETIAKQGARSVHAAGRGKPHFNFRDGREAMIAYHGEQSLSEALRSNQAQPTSLASIDLDANATPDLIVGFVYKGQGIVTVQHGNPDAFAPKDEAVFARLQQGYDPDSLLPTAKTYLVPEPVDFLQAGDFNHDNRKDVLVAARGGSLFLLAGDGTGRLGDPRAIDLAGRVTALAAGEFRAADGFTDIAVGVDGPAGHTLLISDDAVDGFANAVVQYSLAEPASAIEFGGLDDDPFLDVAVAVGGEILVVHGWNRTEEVKVSSRVERIKIGRNVRGLAVGAFSWDRQGRSEIAALTDDGTVHVVEHARLNSRPFSESEAALRTRATIKPAERIKSIESVPSWQPERASGWTTGRKLAASSFAGVSSVSAKPLLRANLSYSETDELVLMGESQPKLEILGQIGPNEKARSESSRVGELTRASLDVESAPVAVLTLPKKLNGVRDVVVLNSRTTALTMVPNAPNTTITVDRTDDPSGAGLTAASACTAATLNDCSLRGAIQFANLAQNNNTTISLPANTYILSINGTIDRGCDGNTVGDLGANRTMSIVGAGAATTIIRQTGTGPANDGDRIMCMCENFAVGLIFNFSGVTFVGGREGTAAGQGAAFGGGGIIGGELDNELTLTNVVMANNQETVSGSANLGGGALQITGGDLTITNCTFGGTAAPGAYADRSSTNTGNSQAGSGGGVTYTPSSPQHTGGTGTLTVTGTTVSRNTASGIGGGGFDLLIFAFASPGGIGSGTGSIGTTTFQNNQALGTASGGGIIVESLPTTVATSSFTNNSAGNSGGGIYVGGGSLLLNGAAPSITFTGNTATNASATSIGTSAIVTVDGTNTAIGGSIQINTGGIWTNNNGSTLAPTNVLVQGGTFNMNNSTMNVSGNLTINPALIVGSTFNGNTGTVNIQGNFVLDSVGGPASTLNAGTGTFNFNGTGAQSITNGTSITFFNLTDSNVTQPLTLNNSFAVNGSLNVNGANAILAPVSAAVISGTGTLTGTGTARVTRVIATPAFLSQYTISNKTLTNLTIDYSGAGAQTVNNSPAYSHLRISGSGTKTLQGATAITGDLTIAAAALDASASNFGFSVGRNWTNNVGAAGFVPRSGTVTFNGSGAQLLTGNTTFFNLTLNNTGGTTQFGATTTTIQNNLVASAGTMQVDTSTIIFTGAAGSINGANAKQFHNLQINGGASITNPTGGNTTILNDFTNNGTYSQAAGLTTTFASGPDGIHVLLGAGTTTFGNFTINGANTVNAGAHNFSVVGANFTGNGTFNSTSGVVTFSGGVAQTLLGDGGKNFSGLTINNGNGVTLNNTTPAVDAVVSGLLTLTTNFTVATSAILQQTGTSTGAADVLGTVRRTDLGGTERAFGNLNNTITVNSGTPPSQLDFNLVKTTPTGFPAAVKVVPRTYTLTPVGGAGISATLKLRYIHPPELNGPPAIPEANLILWKDTTGSDTWMPQGGTVNAANDFVSLSGISSFSEWAIAEGSDLTLTKANSAVSNAAVTGQAWNWTLTAANTGAPAIFTAGQTILSDQLPTSNLNYGTPSVQNVSNITGSANINCAIASNTVTCTALGGSVTFASNLGASSFAVVFSATPQAVGSYQNPRTGGGIAQIDPNNVIPESAETNNSPANNTVTVSAANTTTQITSDDPDPSVVGQPVTVIWSVTVNAPGAVGVPLTGNVTVTDGTVNCSAPVASGQCNLTFTTAGAKNINATYAGSSNYNGSTTATATPHTVNPANTTTTITSDNPDPSSAAQSVTVQWTVTVNSPGAGTPTGNVNVIVSGGAETCSAAVAAGQCSLALNTLGTRTITATYAGNANFNTSADTESHLVASPPTLTKNFVETEIPLNGTATLNFTITNPNSATGLSGIGFTDTLPAGLTAPNATTPATCGGTFSVSSNVITFSGGTLTSGPPGNTCTFGLTVTGTTAGLKTNTTSAITSTEGGTGLTATDTITVVAPPTISKAFGAASILVGGTTSLTFTINNPSTLLQSGIAFTDTLPAGLVVATPNGLSGVCGGTVTADAGTGSISLSGGTIPGSGSCTIIVNVTGTILGVKANTTGAISSTNGGTGATSNTANLTVVGPPTISKAFGVSNIALNGTTSLTFTINNPNTTVGLTGLAFTDTLPGGLVVATPNGLSGVCGGAVMALAGSSSISLSGGTLLASGSCMIAVNVTGTTAGVKNNTTSTISSTNGGTGNTGSATLNVLVVTPAMTGLIINELRSSGPGGSGDDFVELYNNTNNNIQVQTSDASTGWALVKSAATCATAPIVVATIPNGTVIPARGSYLLVGSAYSLGFYAVADQTLASDIENDVNVGLFNSATTFTALTRLDAVGFGSNTGTNCDTLREGTNLAAASGSTSEYAFVRKIGMGGLPQDTNNNSADFAIVSNTPTVAVGANATPVLGAPGPENTLSLLQRTSLFAVGLIEPTALSTDPPNRVRDTNQTALISAPNAGTMEIRRRYTNNTGGTVTQLRFRITGITTLNSPVIYTGQADIRSLTTTDFMITTSLGLLTVKGTLLELPSNQTTTGGGLNSSLTVALPGGGLANGQTLDVNFLLGIKTNGRFAFNISIEALP